MKKKKLSVKDSMRMIYKDLIKVDKNLQSRMVSAFTRGVELLTEICAPKGNCVENGDTERSLCESGHYDFTMAENEIEEAMEHLKKAIFFVEKAEGQPKKKLSLKNGRKNLKHKRPCWEVDLQGAGRRK